MPSPRLILVAPGLLDPPPVLRAAAFALPRTPSLAALLAQGDRIFHGCTTLPEVLAVHAGDARLINACGPLSWAGEGAPPAPGAATCMRAEPVSLVADRDRLRLLHEDGMQADADESDALLGSLNAHFADDGLEFRRGPEGGWYLFSAARLDVRTVPRDALRRRDLRDAQPHGPDAPRLTRWMNEMQMLLHDHPVNRAREQAGRAMLNGIWLWGAGDTRMSIDPPFDAVFADDPLPRALGRYARRLPDGARPGMTRFGDTVLVVSGQMPWPDPSACAAGMERLERGWFAPLRALLLRGRWREVVIDGCDGRAWRCKRVHRWTRWWRRRDITRRMVDDDTD